MAYQVGEGDVSIGADFSRAYKDLGQFTDNVARNLGTSTRGFSQLGKSAADSLKPLGQETKNITQGFQQAQRSGTDMSQAVQRGMSGAFKSVFKLSNIIKGGLAFAFANILAGGIYQSLTNMRAFIQEVVIGTARIKQMDTVLGVLGRRQGFTSTDIQRLTGDIEKMGITTSVAQTTLQEFIRYNLDLEQASKVARVAQDAAVLSNSNSSATLQRLILGISKQNSLMLRNAGLQVQVGQAIDKYAASLGKAADELTSQERTQATLNAVLDEGAKIAGAYEASLTEPLKKLGSLDRVVDTLQGNLGERLYPAFKLIVNEGIDPFVKSLEKASRVGGPLNNAMIQIGETVGGLADDFLNIFTDQVVTSKGPKRFVKEEWEPLLEALSESVELLAQVGAEFVRLGAKLTGGILLTGLRLLNGLLENMEKIGLDTSIALNALVVSKFFSKSLFVGVAEGVKALIGNLKVLPTALSLTEGGFKKAQVAGRAFTGVLVGLKGLATTFLPIAALTAGLEIFQRITERAAEFRQYSADVRDLLAQSFTNTKDMLDALNDFLRGGTEEQPYIDALQRLADFDDRGSFFAAARSGALDVEFLTEELKDLDAVARQLDSAAARGITPSGLGYSAEEFARLESILRDLVPAGETFRSWTIGMDQALGGLSNRVDAYSSELEQAFVNLSLADTETFEAVYGVVRDALIDIGGIGSGRQPGGKTIEGLKDNLRALEAAGVDIGPVLARAKVEADELERALAALGLEESEAALIADQFVESQGGVEEQTRLTTAELEQQAKTLEQLRKRQAIQGLTTEFRELFDAFSEAPKAINISGKQLIANLDSQLEFYDSFYADLATLSEAGFDNVVYLLQSKGPEAATAAAELAENFDLAEELEGKATEVNSFANGLAVTLVQGIEGPERQKVLDAFRKYGADSYQAYQEGFGLVVDDKSLIDYSSFSPDTGGLDDSTIEKFNQFKEQGFLEGQALDEFFDVPATVAKANEMAYEASSSFNDTVKENIATGLPSSVTEALGTQALNAAAYAGGKNHANWYTLGFENTIASARFTIPFGPNSVGGTGDDLGAFDRGGNIPGVRGVPTLISAHAGETVIPSHREPIDSILARAMTAAMERGGGTGGGGGSTINVYNAREESIAAGVQKAAAISRVVIS